MYFQNFESSIVLEKSDCVRNISRDTISTSLKTLRCFLIPPFYSNWFSDMSGKRLIVHCRWRYRISYQFFSVYRVSFLFRFVVFAFVEWRVLMRGEVQRSLRHRYSRKKRERSTGRKLFPDCRGTQLSRRLDFRRFPFRNGRKKSVSRFLTCSREAVENFICICSLTDSASRFVWIYCYDHFASPFSKSLSRFTDIFF